MDPLLLSPAEFEQEMRRILQEEGVQPKDFSTAHLEKIHGTEGDYIFDITARFEALGVDFLVLIECKRQTRPIERQVVQVLADKVQTVGGQKGIIFSTSDFRSGAISYAQKHGIALVHVKDGEFAYQTKGYGPVVRYPPWIPKIMTSLVTLTTEGNIMHSTLGAAGPPEWKPKSNGFLLDHLSE
jgi:restriction system protein